MTCTSDFQPLFPESQEEFTTALAQSVQHIQVVDYPSFPAVRFHEAELVRCGQETDPGQLPQFLDSLLSKKPVLAAISLPGLDRARLKPLIRAAGRLSSQYRIPVYLAPSPETYPMIVEQTLWGIWQDASHHDTEQEIFLRKLIRGDFPHPAEISREAGKPGLPEDGQWYCVIGHVTPFHPFLIAWGDTMQALKDISGRGTRTDIPQPLLACIEAEKLVLFLPARDDIPPEKQIGEFLDKADRCLRKNTESLIVSWAYDLSPAPYSKFSRRYRSSSVALSYGLSLMEEGFRISYESVRRPLAYQYLYNNRDIRRICRQTLKNLVEYSSSKNIDLLQTLAVFFRCNYNVTKTAEDLHLNRQSLIYRLSKIEKLCGISLHDHEDLFFLDLCLHIAARRGSRDTSADRGEGFPYA